MKDLVLMVRIKCGKTRCVDCRFCQRGGWGSYCRLFMKEMCQSGSRSPKRLRECIQIEANPYWRG